MRKGAAKSFDPPEVETQTRRCDVSGCPAEGIHRAPKSRSRLNDYYWFCLDHVREYNKSWNYYADMSEDEVERDIRRSTTWDRPTWPFGTRDGGPSRSQAFRRIRDPFGMFDEEDEAAAAAGRRAEPETAETRAMRMMSLEPPLTLDRLKRRYKELVKRHHPDANGGDKDAEERLKQINEAYTTLRRFLT